MKPSIYAGTLAFVLFVTPTPGEEPPKPSTPRNDAVNLPYSGTVTEVTKNSITVQWPGEPPKLFPVSETLAAGKIPKDPRLIPSRRQPYTVDVVDRYRLEDVKVGDHVLIHY